MADFLNDTFTETSSTALGSHNPEIGGTWVQRNVSSGGTTRDMTVGAGTGTVTAPSGLALFTNSATPAGTDHYGEAVWTPSGASTFSIVFNWTSEGNFYFAELSRYGGEIYVRKRNSWSDDYLASAPLSLPNGTPGTIRYELTVEGANKRIKVFFNASEVINYLDTSALSGVGLVGIQCDTAGACTSIVAGDIGPTGFTITADGGTYSVSGVAADLKAARLVTAEVGSYSWSGVDANLVKATPGAFFITADPGSYTITGTDAYRDLAFNAEGGTYTATGYDVSFTLTEPMAYSITAEPGAYTFAGRTVYLLGPGDTIPTTKSSKLAINIGLRL